MCYQGGKKAPQEAPLQKAPANRAAIHLVEYATDVRLLAARLRPTDLDAELYSRPQSLRISCVSARFSRQIAPDRRPAGIGLPHIADLPAHLPWI